MTVDIVAFCYVKPTGETEIIVTHTWSPELLERLTNLLDQQAIPYEVFSVSGFNLHVGHKKYLRFR